MASRLSRWEGPVPHKYVGEAKGATLAMVSVVMPQAGQNRNQSLARDCWN